MEKNKIKAKKTLKTVLVAVLIIGVCVLAFQTITKLLTENELRKEKEVPTAYANFTAGKLNFEEEDIINGNSEANNLIEIATLVQKDIPDGYTKANYTIGKIDYEFCKDEKETSAEISKETAAEIVARELYKLFGANLEGKEIKMGYVPAQESFPRAKWQGEIDMSDDLEYWFTIDSMTGEIFHIGTLRVPDEQLPFEYDPELPEKCQEYYDLVENTAEKYDIVHGEVESVEYYGQSGTGLRDGANSEVTVTFDVTGTNGEIAQMTFSRYDKALLDVSYNTQCILTNEWLDKFSKRMEEIEEIHYKVVEMYLEDHPEVANGSEKIDPDELKEYFDRISG